MANISERAPLSHEIRRRIQALHDAKIHYNKEKLERYGGAIDIDDHGFICFDELEFTPETHEDGMVYGCAMIGRNLRRFFNAIPAYIHPDSALAGAWAGVFQRFAHIGLRPEDQPPESLRALYEKYDIHQNGVGAMNHLGPDMTIGLQLGWTGLLQKIRYYRDFNAPADTDFYDGEEELVLGVMEYTRRHADYAREMAAQAADSFHRRNYLEIAAANEQLLAGPPRTFREACQFLAHFQSIDRTYYAGGALGQIDELLRPYYEKDVQDGVLTDEEAVWMIASLLYNDTHYAQVGGQLPDGSRGLTSRLSYLILQATHEIHIPNNLAVRVYEGMDEDLLRRAVEYILEDGSGCCFSLSKGIEEGFVKNGHPMELARMRAKVGCNWVALPGIEYPLQDVTRLNMAQAFVHALDELMASDAEPTLEGLWDCFYKHLAILVQCNKDSYDWHYEVVSRNTPEIVLNLFCHGPIERGLNCAQGGVDIVGLNVDGIALATVADSFAAIEQRIVKEQRLTWRELYDAVKSDFAGTENIRLMLNNISRFGAPDSPAEKWAVRTKDAFVSLVKAGPTPKHHLDVIPGMFSHGDVYAYGVNLPATPNGRHAGDPISHSTEPDPGFAKGLSSFSPTLKANAVAKTQPGYGNSAPLHLDIDPAMLGKENGADALMALIHAHEQMGGTLINMNCVTKEQIRRAHADPESEPDLVVRVTGYSAFFASLSKEYRQQIVDRYLTVEEQMA